MIQLKSDDIDVYLERARHLEDGGEIDQAVEVYRACAEELERSGSTEEFLEVAAHVLELDAEQSELRTKLVEALLAETQVFLNYGLYDRALQALAKALEHAPTSLKAHQRRVAIFERQRQPIAFIEAVGDLARRAPGGRRVAAAFLNRAFDWLGREERIYELAETLEVDLNEHSDELAPPSIDSTDGGLGSEETTPHDGSMATFARESTRNHGVVLGGAGRSQNLLAFLQRVERCSVPTRLIIENGKGETVAELNARAGRLEIGVRLDGEVYVDKPLRRVSSELAERLEQTGRGDEVLTPSNTTTGERSQLYRLTARALVELAVRGESQHFCIRSRQQEQDDDADHLSFSPFALIMRAAGYLHSDSNKAAAHFFDLTCDESEEAWLLVNAADDAELCLPFRTSSTTPLRVSEVRKLGRAAHRVLQYNRSMREHLGGEHATATSFSMGDGLWCAVSGGSHMALVRSESHQIGTTLSKARQATNAGAGQ